MSATPEFGATRGSRTHTRRGLNPLPLPIALEWLVVGMSGFEPETRRLWVWRSANWATFPIGLRPVAVPEPHQSHGPLSSFPGGLLLRPPYRYGLHAAQTGFLRPGLSGYFPARCRACSPSPFVVKTVCDTSNSMSRKSFDTSNDKIKKIPTRWSREIFSTSYRVQVSKWV